MAQNSFVYDPSANIRESFKDVSTNIGTAFSNIIAQKQQDLALADKVFQNLDAIKEETAAIGSSRINAKIKELTQQAPSKMFKDGKIDFEGMGQVVSGVSQIKQLKNYWTNAAELKKQYLQLGSATNKDMTSLSSFVAQMDPLIAENEGGSIEDLKKKMSSLYDSHLDYTNMAREKVASVLPVDEYGGEMKNKDGGITGYSFKAPKDMVFNPETGKVEMPAPQIVIDPSTNKPVIDQTTGQPKTITYLEKVKNALTQGDPAYFDKYRGHFGLSKALVSDDAVAKQVLDSFATAPKFKEVKSYEEIQTEKNKLKISNVEAANVEELTRLKKEEIRASIKAAKARYQKAISGGGKSPFPKNYVRPNVLPQKDGSKHLPLTKPVTITATGANYTVKDKDGKNVIKRGTLDTTGKGAAKEFEITKIIKTADGHYAASGYEVVKGYGGQKGAAKQIVLSKKDYNDFVNKLGGMDPVNRFSNSLALLEKLGAPYIPDTYLNIEQDTSPNGDWEDQ
jgi:hypothetical protein